MHDPDPALLMAREIVADLYRDEPIDHSGIVAAIEAGEYDGWPAVKCAVTAIKATQKRERRLHRILKGWADWYRFATADDDCEYLNGKAWDDAEALADSTMAALREDDHAD